MPKKADTKKQKEQLSAQAPEKKGTGLFEYLRFGESYTSLILGIIVVIITTALLLSFVHNKNAGNVNTPISEETQNTIQVSQQTQEFSKQAPNSIDTAVSIGPVATVIPTETPQPTAVPKPTVKPTAAPKPTTKPKVVSKPTQKPNTKKVVIKQLAKIKATPTPAVITDKDTNVWVVQKGESLWVIAEKKYTSGYNWVDIAKANNLADPSDIHVGDRLILPSIAPKESTITIVPTTHPSTNVQKNRTINTKISPNKIMGNTYTVIKGDSLWNISVRAYGDGYRWTDIAKANNLVNPSMIFSGNVLKIPRK